ncbi:dr1-associated corepressor-like [Schistocerca gregaria]|uniref:dr1-associated corepressor-like n=1 Tax=Schistocerca gregaria TaxID=7010 RepID=UPI00211E9CE5|nr:dr1-associated corepressor-like [Schistocerca gregaria]
MPTKKKKYNARFPAGRIKKIMQTDEEVGKVAQAVPVIISRTLELFVESLLKKAMEITSAKNAKTLSPSHMKQCILSESRFDFLKDLVKNLPDVASCDGEEGNSPFLPSPPCGNTAGYIDLSVGTRRLPETDVKKETGQESVTPTPIMSHPLPVQTVPAVVTNQLHANFYKETDDSSPSYGQVPVTSEGTIGRGSIFHVTPADSPQPAAVVMPAVEAIKPERVESNLLCSTATGITSVIDTVSSSETAIGAFNAQTPLVIPQYVKTEVSIALDDDCDTT